MATYIYISKVTVVLFKKKKKLQKDMEEQRESFCHNQDHHNSVHRVFTKEHPLKAEGGCLDSPSAYLASQNMDP